MFLIGFVPNLDHQIYTLYKVLKASDEVMKHIFQMINFDVKFKEHELKKREYGLEIASNVSVSDIPTNSYGSSERINETNCESNDHMTPLDEMGPSFQYENSSANTQGPSNYLGSSQPPLRNNFSKLNNQQGPGYSHYLPMQYTCSQGQQDTNWPTGPIFHGSTTNMHQNQSYFGYNPQQMPNQNPNQTGNAFMHQQQIGSSQYNFQNHLQSGQLGIGGPGPQQNSSGLNQYVQPGMEIIGTGPNQRSIMTTGPFGSNQPNLIFPRNLGQNYMQNYQNFNSVNAMSAPFICSTDVPGPLQEQPNSVEGPAHNYFQNPLDVYNQPSYNKFEKDYGIFKKYKNQYFKELWLKSNRSRKSSSSGRNRHSSQNSQNQEGLCANEHVSEEAREFNNKYKDTPFLQIPFEELMPPPEHIRGTMPSMEIDQFEMDAVHKIYNVQASGGVSMSKNSTTIIEDLKIKDRSSENSCTVSKHNSSSGIAGYFHTQFPSSASKQAHKRRSKSASIVLNEPGQCEVTDALDILNIKIKEKESKRHDETYMEVDDLSVLMAEEKRNNKNSLLNYGLEKEVLQMLGEI